MIKHEVIRSARKRRKWTQAELAERAGISLSLVKKIETGQAPDTVKGPEIARALGISIDSLFDHIPDTARQNVTGAELIRVNGRLIRVVGSVEAGVWREAIQYQEGTEPEFPVAEHPHFAGFDQFLLEVTGDSMDRYYPPGSLLHCVKLAFQPRDIDLVDGDHVIVERNRAGLIETSVKELHDGKLWPRSSNPKHQSPVAVGEHENDNVAIVALVIGSYALRPGVKYR